jgi:hypothetical protein
LERAGRLQGPSLNRDAIFAGGSGQLGSRLFGR